MKDFSGIGAPTGRTPEALFEPLPPVARAACGLCGEPTLWAKAVPRGEVAMADNLGLRSVRGATVHCQGSHEFHVRDKPTHPVEGMLRTVTLDLCPECFEGKLLPWFTAQGGKARITDEAWGDDAGYERPDLNERFEEPQTAHEQRLIGQFLMGDTAGQA